VNNLETSTKQTQQKRILAYLRNGGTLTQGDSREKIKVVMLTSRISELRAKGYEILAKKHSYIDADGTRIRFNEYYMEQGA